MVNVTSSIAALSEEVRAEVLNRVRNFRHFTPDNDPWQEHDYGAFKIGNSEFFWWKIDYYDREMECGSGAPCDPSKNTRVLTIGAQEDW